MNSTLKALTLNLWHGLNPFGFIEFKPLESAKNRRIRERAQIHLIKQLEPDLVFLQEVNPAVSRAEEFKKQLGYAMVHQTVLSGIKLFGRGIPRGLDFGLCILAKPPG